MPRATNNVAAKRRHKKYLRAAKGYYGARSKTYKIARQTVEKGLTYAFRDRKAKKRDFRRLWIVRINAACRLNDISYSKFIAGLHQANIKINRKVLAHLAWHDAPAFAKLVELVKK
ncbi:MAG TPA: 50S ribosomal protein L20 [Candidatus Cloacimonadota bacterium]|nr:50S ribosomal protein L20 [Candidatus Cloacimonadota bacterium]HOV16856.1 50S ribosomal protein L20 [Candidatus Cloacimonadota bacterium]HQL14514.1 50S ribosomal protein L20 [Candidatus Cloacimonadota bacterium]